MTPDKRMPQFHRCANVFLSPIHAIMDATIISTFLYGQNALRRIQCIYGYGIVDELDGYI